VQQKKRGKKWRWTSNRAQSDSGLKYLPQKSEKSADVFCWAFKRFCMWLYTFKTNYNNPFNIWRPPSTQPKDLLCTGFVPAVLHKAMKSFGSPAHATQDFSAHFARMWYCNPCICLVPCMNVSKTCCMDRLWVHAKLKNGCTHAHSDGQGWNCDLEIKHFLSFWRWTFRLSSPPVY